MKDDIFEETGNLVKYSDDLQYECSHFVYNTLVEVGEKIQSTNDGKDLLELKFILAKLRDLTNTVRGLCLISSDNWDVFTGQINALYKLIVEKEDEFEEGE